MPKKSSSKSVVTKPEETAKVDQKMPASTPKKMGSEIDEIFATKKKPKPEQETSGKTSKNRAANERRKERKKRSIGGSVERQKESKNRRIEGSSEKKVKDTPSWPRKKTNDGLKVYTEEELGFGKANAGGTRLCPFDCSCCF